MEDSNHINTRLSSVTRNLNVSLSTAINELEKWPDLGPTADLQLNTKITQAQYRHLQNTFSRDKDIRERADNFSALRGKRKDGHLSKEEKTDYYNMVGTIPGKARKKGKKKKETDPEKLKRQEEIKAQRLLEKKQRKEESKKLQDATDSNEQDKPKDIKSLIYIYNISIKNGLASFKKKGVCYKYTGCIFSKAITKKLAIYVTSLKKPERTKLEPLPITINQADRTFTFDNQDFKLDKYLERLTQKPQPVLKKAPEVKNRIPLGMNNIEFFDGYYEVFITKGGVKDKTIKAKQYPSVYSTTQLRWVKKQLIEKLAKDIYIYFNSIEVLALSKPLDLSKTIDSLSRSYQNSSADWGYVGHVGKLSLNDCIKTTKKPSYYKELFHSPYLDYLFPLIKDEKLILAYESNNGNDDAAFLIPVALKGDNIAIIFENVAIDSNTTTEVFITTREKYKKCLQSVFDYFTDDGIRYKRYNIRRRNIDPKEFDAEYYYFVDHDDFSYWCLRLKRILSLKFD